MPGWLRALADWLISAPDAVFLVTLGLAAGLENIVPPIPADVVVVVGSGLAVRAGTHLVLLFLAVWIGNVGGALLVYLLGRRYGMRFFHGRIGRFLLRPGQLEAVNRAYHRYGFVMIFLSRFLPMFRAVVPVFAGVARVGFLRTAVPMAIASGIWYGALVYVGATAGRNWEMIMEWLQSTSRSAWALAIAALLPIAWWWWKTR